MPDDPNNSTPDPQQPTAPAPQSASPVAPTVTPEVQAMIDTARAEAAKQATDAAWKQARLKYEKPAGAGQQPQQPPKDPPPNGNVQDAFAAIKLRDAFDDAISDHTLTGAQRRFVRDLVMEKRPDDVAGYVSNFVTLSGWSSSTPNPTPSNPSPAPAPSPDPAKPAPPGSPTAPNKVGRIDSGQLLDVSTLTEAERLALGPAGIRAALERVIEAGQSRDGRPPVPAVLRKQR